MKFHRKITIMVGCLIFCCNALFAVEQEGKLYNLSLKGYFYNQGKVWRIHSNGSVDVVIEVENDNGIRSMNEKDLKIKVNGKDVAFVPSQSESRADGKRMINRKRGMLPLGEPGVKKIEIQYKDLKLKKEIDFQPKSYFTVGGIYEGQTLLKGDSSVAELETVCIKADTLAVSVNGKKLDKSQIHTTIDGTSLIGKIEPDFNVGKNKIIFSAKDIYGEKMQIERTIYYYPDNQIPVGHELYIFLAPQGSKNGPFYRTKIEGNSIENLTRTREEDSKVLTEGGMVDQWMDAGIFMAELKAVRPGKATIKIEEYSYDDDKAVTINVPPSSVKKVMEVLKEEDLDNAVWPGKATIKSADSIIRIIKCTVVPNNVK